MNNLDSGTAVGATGTIIETILAVSQANETLQTIQIILSIITFVVTICYTIWRWYKKATSDDSKGGKNITKDEIDELVEDVKKEVDKNDRD